MTVAIPRAVLDVVLLACLAAAATLLVATVAGRAWRRRRERRDDALSAAPRRRLYSLVIDAAPTAEPDDDPEQAADLAHLTGLDRRTWRALEPTLLSLAVKVRGDARRAVVTLLERRGAVESAVTRSRRPGAVGRARAAELLGLLGGSRATAELARLVGDRSADVRAVAARALGRVADPATATLLADLLVGSHRGRVPSQVVAQALVSVGHPAQAPLRAALGDARPEVRGLAVGALGLMGAVGAVDDLVAVLASDDDVEVRSRAARALGVIGSPHALAALLDATEPAVPEVLRATAATALGEVGAASSTAALAVLVGDPAHWVAHNAAVSLTHLGAGGTRALCALAEGPDAGGREHARDALAATGIGRPDARPAVAA